MKLMSSFWRKSLWSILSLVILFMLGSGLILFYMASQLPEVDNLNDIKLQVPLRIYTSDGQLIAEFGETRRIPVTLDKVPIELINALLATEDQRFYSHPGIDLRGLARAALELIKTGSKSQGGSTITMQVARNYFLSREKSFFRKFNEILLSFKIEHKFSKDKILELYLNKIFLGNRAYGVETAAQVYYGKSLTELNLPQLAMIAGLPKAPSILNPIADPQAAFKRRNHVLARMRDEGYIDETTYQQAIQAPVTARYHGSKTAVHAPYVAEMVRASLYQHFGEDLYSNGYQVYTTIDSKLQSDANSTVQEKLLAYDHRHGYRGPEKNIRHSNVIYIQGWMKQLKEIPTIHDLLPAAVTKVSNQSANALLSNGDIIEMNWQGLSWARKQLPHGRVGFFPKQAGDILKIGDVILVQQADNEQWRLTQYPEAETALVSLDPKDGAIQALVGGFNYKTSEFNRVTQAARQPGSSFKPFLYTAALSKGLTFATMINDAPFVIDDPSQQSLWRPENDNLEFNGPTRLRTGLIRSRNIVSIRMLQTIGIPYAIDFISRFGFDPAKLPRTLSLALGSLDVTPLELIRGYAVFANGGFKVSPYLIQTVTDLQDQIIYQAQPLIACPECDDSDVNSSSPIDKEQQAPRVLSPQLTYLMTTALQDVIKEGTGRAAKVLKRHDLAGKTGTTNDQIDAWFAGYNTDLVTVVWVGFDLPQSLYEYSAQAALPMWIDFMGKALAGKPEHSMIRPSGLVTVRIDPATGLLAKPGQKNSIFETFIEGNLPEAQANNSEYYQTLNNSGSQHAEYLF